MAPSFPDGVNIDILCKVVDNFGDIGFVYRLAKALSEAAPELRLRLIVDNLDAFRALYPEIDTARDVQEVRGWTIARWSKPWEGFRSEPPRLILECFACGRPDWYEEILFAPARAGEPARESLIVNLEHLSAEGYAEDFHLLDSLTRSPLVKKRIFMPGFSPKTGGLIIERGYAERFRRQLDPALAQETRLAIAGFLGRDRDWAEADRFWLSVFSYERDYSGIVADLGRFGRERPLLALVAHGKSQVGFVEAWKKAGSPFPIVELPFLTQEQWDEIILASDFNIVRGEDSLARAALAGRPFLWQAYLQDEGHQLVKVAALLERLRPLFPRPRFAPLETLFLAFNDRRRDDPTAGGTENILGVLRLHDELKPGFRALAEELQTNGNLAEHLLTFISKFV